MPLDTIFNYAKLVFPKDFNVGELNVTKCLEIDNNETRKCSPPVTHA